MSGFLDYPTGVREKLRAAVDEAFATGATDDELANDLTDRVHAVADQAILQATMFMLGQHLKTLPEQERKALMFDVLVKLGMVNGASPKRRRLH